MPLPYSARKRLTTEPTEPAAPAPEPAAPDMVPLARLRWPEASQASASGALRGSAGAFRTRHQVSECCAGAVALPATGRDLEAPLCACACSGVPEGERRAVFPAGACADGFMSQRSHSFPRANESQAAPVARRIIKRRLPRANESQAAPVARLVRKRLRQ